MTVSNPPAAKGTHPGDHQDPEVRGQGGALQGRRKSGRGHLVANMLVASRGTSVSGAATRPLGESMAHPGPLHAGCASALHGREGKSRIHILSRAGHPYGGEVRQLLADRLGEGAEQGLAAEGGHLQRAKKNTRLAACLC